MPHRNLIVKLIGIILILLCCSLVYIFWDGYYLPNKPCRPILYPTGIEPRPSEGQSNFYSTEDSVSEVVQFYDQRLDAIPTLNSDDWVGSRWIRLKLGAASYVYECRSLDINRITKEQGCIYVNETNDGTLVETLFYRYEEETSSCSERVNGS
jgi:hypothetical protein